MEPLIEIPYKNWSQLVEEYKVNWPNAAVAISLLKMQIIYPNIREAIKFEIYCPRGNVENGIIAETEFKNRQEIYIISSINGISEVEDALLSTRQINWHRVSRLINLSPEVVDCLERIQTQLGISLNYDVKVNKLLKFVRNKDSKVLEDLSCPINTYVANLKAEYIDLVNNTWAYRNINSRDLLEHRMKNGLIYALYSINTNEVLSWITVSEVGYFSHLYCVEEHRKKGYGEYIIKYATKDRLDKGFDVLCYTAEHNLEAQKLFKKLGLHKDGYNIWINVGRKV